MAVLVGGTVSSRLTVFSQVVGMGGRFFWRRGFVRAFSGIALAVAMCCAPAAHATPVESLRVMSYNIWNGGFGALQPLTRTAAVIQAAGADIIGLQEASASVDDLANLLGFHWFYFNPDLSILSRYPITQGLPGAGLRGRGVKIELSPGQEVYFFDAHLEPDPYEPYDIRDGLITTEAQAIASAQAARGASTTTLLSNMSGALATDRPVFLVGDFNEPSHLDWTQEAADAGLNFSMKVDWPTSNAIVNAGFIDAFRELRPDEVNDQARTWTPGYPPPMVDVDEVHDRIDFVYYNAPANVMAVEALTIGYDPNDGFTDIAAPPDPNGRLVPYPSDHRAVVVEFELSNPPGDFDFDGDVDGLDFLNWQRGESPAPLSADDLADWEANYGAQPLSAQSNAVPEPGGTSLVVIMMASTVLFTRSIRGAHSPTPRRQRDNGPVLLPQGASSNSTASTT